MPLALSNGITINYRIDGPVGDDTAPWVTFVTGITNDIAMWADHVPALGRDFRLLRLDTRGHGASQATPPPYSFDQLTADIAGVWDALGIRRSHLVGIGLGGMTTMAMALRHPDRVSAIVPTACRAEIVPEYEAIWPPMLEKSAAGGIEAIVDITSERWFPDAFRAANPDVMHHVRAMIRRTSLAGYHGCIRALLAAAFGAKLPEMKMPALFVSGALDMLGGPPEVMADMAVRVANGRQVTLPDAGHICSMANPRAFEAALQEFLTNCPQ